MKNLICLFCNFLLLPTILLTQNPISITFEQYNLDMDGITVVPGQADFGIPAVPESGVNMDWNYGTIFGNNTATGHQWINGDLCFIGTDRRANTSVPNLNIQSEWLYSADLDGIRTLGLNQANSVLELDGGGTIEWLDTCQLFSEDQFWLPFPANFQDKWIRDITEVRPFIFNFPGFYEDAPGVFIRRNFVADTISGWGKVTIPTNLGPQTFDALLTERDLFQLDSFFINGQPASDTVMTILGREQGDMLLQRSYSFRSNDNEILLSIATDILDNVLGFSYLSDPLIITSNDPEVEESSIELFPNPIRNKQFYLHQTIPFQQATQLVLYNGLGQKVFTKDLQELAKQSIYLPTHLSSGIYWINIAQKDGELIYQTQVLIQ